MNPRSGGQYRCCVNIDREGAEQFVTEVVLARLAQPKVFRQLRKASDKDDRALVEDRREIDKLTAELGTWRASAIAGQTSPDSLAVIEAGIMTKLRDAQRTAERAGVPPVVRDLVEPGGDVRARWHAATLGARRDVVRTMLKVTLHSSWQRGRRPVDRVELEWR
jgi:site-specific DNA recombinase